MVKGARRHETANGGCEMHTAAKASVWVAHADVRGTLWVFFCLAAVAAMAGCGGGGATFAITHPPRFTTCEAGLPAARAGYPAGSYGRVSADIVTTCGGGPSVSGSDTMYTYRKVDAPVATDRVFQALSEVGAVRTPGVACGDRITPVMVRLVEFFNVPANDAIVTANCCEWMYDTAISAQVLVLDTTALPAAAQAAIPAIAADENAEILDPLLTPEQLRDVRDRIRANKQISWGQRYEYDGCNPPPNSTTTCGNVHCQDIWWTDANGTGRQDFSGGR
jgi:hypothetical protein